MNLEQLSKHQDRTYEVRPVPLSKTAAGMAPSRFNEWKITIAKGRGEINLRHISTGHHLDLGLDNFREYRSPKFLLLKCQLIFDGGILHAEPLPHGIW